MKLVNKIFVIIGSLTFLLIFALMFNFWLLAEITSADVIAASFRKGYSVGEFNHLKVLKGNWHVRLFQDDSSYVRIFAGDNMHANYMDINVINDTLILDIKEEFKYHTSAYQVADISVKNLKSLRCENITDCRIEGVKLHEIDLLLRDFSSLSIDSSNIGKLEIAGEDFSTATMLNTKIDSIEYILSGVSTFTIKNKPSFITGTTSGNSSIIAGDYSAKSDSALTEFSNLLPFMPKLVFFENERKLDSLMKTEYGANKRNIFRPFENVKGNSSSKLDAKFSRVIAYSYGEGSLFNNKVQFWNFLFNKGILNDIYIFFPNENQYKFDEIYSRLKNYLGGTRLERYETSDVIKENYKWQIPLKELAADLIVILERKKSSSIEMRVYLRPDVTKSQTFPVRQGIYTTAPKMVHLWERFYKRIFENSDVSLLPREYY